MKNEDGDPISIGCFRIRDVVYRFKIWDSVVWMERQGFQLGRNINFIRNDDPDADLLYSDHVWDLEAMDRLIIRYENDQLD